jgi:hypothetical protein
VKLARLLGGDLGWAGAAGTLLLAGFGLVLVVLGALELRSVAVPKPEERGCEEWLAEVKGPRWVTLGGCRVEVAPVRTLGARRFVSLGERGGAPMLLEVTEPPLVALVEKLGALPAGEVGAYVAAHAADFEALVAPKVVSGWAAPLEVAVEPGAPGAWVLVQGALPPRGQVVLRVLVGIVALAVVLRPLGRRWLLAREGDDAAPPQP